MNRQRKSSKIMPEPEGVTKLTGSHNLVIGEAAIGKNWLNLAAAGSDNW
jgi:hypothetical protein